MNDLGVLFSSPPFFCFVGILLINLPLIALLCIFSLYCLVTMSLH